MSTQQPEDHPSPVPIPPEIASAPVIERPSASPATVEHVPETALQEHHAEFASFHEEYVRHYIQFADTKAGVGFSVISAVLAFLIGKPEVQKLLLQPAWTANFGITVSSLLFLLASAICAFLVIAPRLASSPSEGIVFFGAVAKRSSSDDYIGDIASRSAAELAAARLRHSYDISKICTRKYALLKKAIWLALPGLALEHFQHER
jgi:hypothetical protein